MYRICLLLLLVSAYFLPVQAQQKSQRPEDIQKIQSLQKGIQPNGKNATVVHPTKSDGTMDMRYKANKAMRKYIFENTNKIILYLAANNSKFNHIAKHFIRQ